MLLIQVKKAAPRLKATERLPAELNLHYMRLPDTARHHAGCHAGMLVACVHELLSPQKGALLT
jgi:hypothetical protein